MKGVGSDVGLVDYLAATEQAIRAARALEEPFLKAVDLVHGVLLSGGCVFWAGNGGSAAECQHLAAELVGRFRVDRLGLRSVALTADSSVLTALANDYGFDAAFGRQVQSLGHPGDALITLSTSGESPNVLEAIRRAKEIGMRTIAFTGPRPCSAGDLSDIVLAAPGLEVSHIQEVHLTIGHALCERLEARVTMADKS